MIVILTGTRSTNPERAKRVIEDFLDAHRCQSYPITFYHGGSGNVDQTAGRMFSPEGIRYQKVFRADWDTHGKAAGPIRNREMIETALSSGERILGLAIWDGKSPGTFNCIQEMIRRGIKVVVHPAIEPVDGIPG